MEKIKLKLDNNEPTVKFSFNDSIVEVKKFLNIETKIIILQNYINTLFQDGVDDGEYAINFVEAEYSIILAVVDKCTNIDISEIKPDSIINSGLWDKIINNIDGYFDFMDEVDKLVEIYEAKRSIGFVLDDLSKKLNGFLDNLSKMDMSKEGLDKLTKVLTESKEQISAINDAVENPVKIPLKRRTRKKA